MLYGLAKNQKYFASKLDRALIMAPCYASTLPGLDSYEAAMGVVGPFFKNGICSTGGAAWPVVTNKICDDWNSPVHC